MTVPFIDIHTHRESNTKTVAVLLNTIVGKDEIPSGLVSLGIHPWYISEPTYRNLLKQLQEQAGRANVLAIGECGLDKICKTAFTIQEKIFTEQIKLANVLQKPLIIHEVRALQDVVRLLDQYNNSVPVIFHGFRKNIQAAEMLLERGYFLSFGKTLCTQRGQEIFKSCPLNRIFLETDDSSVPIQTVYQIAADCHSILLDDLKVLQLNNFQNVFKSTGFTE